MSSTQNRILSKRRSIISCSFSLLASMKCSLMALFSRPYASANSRTARPYFLVLRPSINFAHTVSVIGWPCDPVAVGCVHRLVPVLLLPLAAPSPAGRLGESMHPRPGAASPPSRPSATPVAPLGFHPRPFLRAVLPLAALQSDMVSS